MSTTIQYQLPLTGIRFGDRVRKTGGDYRFEGQVVSIFQKRSGKERCVVENNDGVLHIFNLDQLAKV